MQIYDIEGEPFLGREARNAPMMPTKRVGGKAKRTLFIRTHLTHHRRLVDAFAGSGSVLLSGMPLTGLEPAEVFNDLDDHIANLMRVIKQDGTELARRLRLTPYGQEAFETACQIIETGDPQVDDLERARAYLIYNRQSFGGKGGGTWSVSCKGEHPVQTWTKLPAVIERCSRRLADVAIENMDYQDVIKKYDGPETCFFLDPPYEGVENRYYDVNRDGGFDHEELRRAICQDILDFSVRNIGASGLACLSNPGHWLDSRLTGETSRRYTQLRRWAGRGEGFPGGLFVIDHSVDSHSR